MCSQSASAKEEVEKKCVKQFENSELNALETEATGEGTHRNLEICTKCPKCGHWIDNYEFKQHSQFHAAVVLDGLLLGDRFAAESRKELIERNHVTHVVNASS